MPKNKRVAIYARVSTLDQKPQMQLRELRAYAKQRRLNLLYEFVAHASGAKDQRPELDQLWRHVRSRKVDIVLVWKFDRFARSTKQLVIALEEFNHLGVDFISLTEQIDTSAPMGKALFTIISALAELERSDISDRVRSGLANAKAQGKRLGQRPLDEKTVKEIRRLRHQEKKSLRQIAKQLGVARQTVANYSQPLKEIKEPWRNKR